jgi:hypothetical protein
MWLLQVSVDANGALTAALAGLINLPPSFFNKECPAPAALAAAALAKFSEEREPPSIIIEDENPNVPVP